MGARGVSRGAAEGRDGNAHLLRALGIPLGAGVIGGAWLLTAAYVVWANREYDPEVERLRSGRVGAE